MFSRYKRALSTLATPLSLIRATTTTATMLSRYKRVLSTLATPLSLIRATTTTTTTTAVRRYASSPTYGFSKPIGTEWRRPLTHLERDYAAELLQHGCQSWEVALRIGRSLEVVRRELRSNKSLARLLQEFKTGPWSDEERDRFDELLHDQRGGVLDKEGLARDMGRPVSEIAREIVRMNKARKKSLPPAVVGGTPLPKGSGGAAELSMMEKRMLRRRMNRILEGLFRAPMTDTWRDVVASLPREEWAERILALVPTPVGRMLASSRPPTAAELNQVGWEDTDKMGVYAWMLTPRQHNPVMPLHYLYVGSATSSCAGGGGLALRRAQHEAPITKGSNSTGLHKRMKHYALSRRWAKFTTLFSVRVGDNAGPEEIVEMRRLVVLAEAVFTVWLGALEEEGSGRKEEKEKEEAKKRVSRLPNFFKLW